MIGMALVEELVKTTILTGRVANRGTHPVSLMLISPPEHGKTTVVMNHHCDTLMLINDMTGNGLREIVRNANQTTHIALLDLLMATSHRASASQFLMANIAAIAEEGFIGEATPKGVHLLKEPVKKAFIICMTPSMAKDGRSRWSKAGITTRMLPFSYTFKESHKNKIREAINFPPERVIEINLNGFKVPEKMLPVKFPDKLIRIVDAKARSKSDELGDDTGFRRLKQFRALACAHAIYRTWKAPSVCEQDVAFIDKINKHISYHRGQEL